MAKITIREAARLVGKDRTTLYRYIESGDLSIIVENRGKQPVKVVDTAELERVFGPLGSNTQQHPSVESRQHTIVARHPENVIAINSLQQQVQLLQQQLAKAEERESMLQRRLDAAEAERAQMVKALTDQREKQIEQSPGVTLPVLEEIDRRIEAAIVKVIEAKAEIEQSSRPEPETEQRRRWSWLPWR
jgi:hypothetical protein